LLWLLPRTTTLSPFNFLSRPGLIFGGIDKSIPLRVTKVETSLSQVSSTLWPALVVDSTSGPISCSLVFFADSRLQVIPYTLNPVVVRRTGTFRNAFVRPLYGAKATLPTATYEPSRIMNIPRKVGAES